MRHLSLATILMTLLALPVCAAEKKCELKRVAELPGTINGKPMRFLVDSGASRSLLDRAAAAKVGITAHKPGDQGHSRRRPQSNRV